MERQGPPRPVRRRRHGTDVRRPGCGRPHRLERRPGRVLGRIKSVAEKPDLVDRGVSMFTMNRAYFESRLFDDGYGRLFGHAGPQPVQQLCRDLRLRERRVPRPTYPYFFDVDGFPGVQLVGITAAAQTRNRRPSKADPDRPRPRHPVHGRHLGPHLPRRRPGRRSAGASRRPPPAPVPGLVWGLDADNLSPTPRRRSRNSS